MYDISHWGHFVGNHATRNILEFGFNESDIDMIIHSFVVFCQKIAGFWGFMALTFCFKSLKQIANTLCFYVIFWTSKIRTIFTNWCRICYRSLLVLYFNIQSIFDLNTCMLQIFLLTLTLDLFELRPQKRVFSSLLTSILIC